MRAAATSRLNTQAKNLTQQRFESMRDLQFHVDRQNGPFVDLLDIYYTSLGTTPVTRTRANETEVAKWVSGGAASPAPSGAFFQVTVSALPGFPKFSQVIDTQFLNATGTAASASSLTGYDSQTEGKDSPPTLMVGITVITTWADHGASHSFTSYSRIADSRGLTSTLTSQGSAEFLRVSSTGEAGNSLTVDLASADATGGQSTGSAAAADARALQAHDSTGQDYLGATGVATAPTGGVTVNSPVSVSSSSSGGCDWLRSGQTQVDNVSAATDPSLKGLPQVPSNVDVNSPPQNQVAAQLTSAGNGPCGGIFAFSNQSTSYASNLMLSNSVPLVRIKNDSQHNVVVNGSSWVNATSAATAPHSVTSGANASSTKRVQLFPGASFIDDGAGVVDIMLSQASISCASTVSNGTVTQTSAGSWNVTIDSCPQAPPGVPRATPPTTTGTPASTPGAAAPLAALTLSSIVVYQNGSTTLHLSAYFPSGSPRRSIT